MVTEDEPMADFVSVDAILSRLLGQSSPGDITVTPERVAVTLGVLFVIIVGTHLLGRFRRHRAGEIAPLTNLAISTVIAALTASGAFAIIAIWGLSGALVDAYQSLDLGAQLPNVMLSIIILGGAYGLSDFIGQVLKTLAADQDAIGDHEKEVLYRSTQVGIYAVAILVVLGLFTDNVEGLFVGAGFLGLVVGMAARQTLGAVLAGFVIMFSRPFTVGDWIVVGENEGRVTEITIMNTRIRTFDGELVVIPNDTVSGTAVTNRTENGRLRIEVEVGVDYGSDLESAAAVAQQAVERVDQVLDRPEPKVVHKRVGDSAIVLGVRFWIDNPSARRRWKTQTAVIEAVVSAFEAEEIKIPFPQRELMARAETGGFRLDERSPREADSRQQTAGADVSTDGGNE